MSASEVSAQLDHLPWLSRIANVRARI